MPGWAPATTAEQHSHTFAEDVATFRASGGGGTMVWARHYRPMLDIKGLRYLTLRYRARNLNPELRSYFFYLSDATDGRMTSQRLALGSKHLILDGKWHTLTTQLKIRGTLGGAAIRFQALPQTEAVVEISHLSLSRDRPRFPIADTLPWQTGAAVGQGQPVALALSKGTPLPELQKALAISDWFTADEVVIAGVPFRVSLRDHVSVSTVVKQKQTIAFPVGVLARSLWLLLGAQLSPRILTYDGWQPGDSINQPERFSVRVLYEDGTDEHQLPYCVDMREHAIWRGLHVYEIAVEDKPVREIQVRDGMVTSAFHAIALTAGSERLTPAIRKRWGRPGGAFVREEISVAPAREGETTVFTNRAGSLRLDRSRGLAVTALQGDLGTKWRIRPEPLPLFTVTENGQGWTSEQFHWQQSQGAAGTATSYRGDCPAATLGARVRVETRERGEFAFRLSLLNRAGKTRLLTVTFPQIRLGLDASPDDLSYFIPRSCGVMSSADRVFRSPYGGKFPVQWMDFYDAKNGGGVYVATRSRSVRHRWYEAGKEGGVGVARIEYLDNVPLPPGEQVEYPLTVIGLHPGDWHAAHEAYLKWRATWHKPQRPRLDWFRRVWHLRTHWVRTLSRGGVSGQAEWNWFDPQSGKLRPEEFIERDLKLFDHIDYIHLFDWRDSTKYGRWGDYCHYDDYGGLANFRTAIETAQDRGIPIGLYLDTYLVSRKSLIGQKHGREWTVVRQNGRIGDGYSKKHDPTYNMCLSQPEWQNYMAKTCARVAQETGCNGIYLDEGGMNAPGYWCWRKDHGHPVPATTFTGQKLLFEKVKSALPDNVALYTEYSPPDALIPHLDGAYMASLRTTDLRWSPGYLNISRFAFPDFKIFVIPNAGSMFDGIYDGLKYSLFNGVALYSLSWGHDEEAYPLCAKIGRILKGHEDAFLTMGPRPLVPTERNQVYANEFPGIRQTVWTLWNGRFRTITGEVIRVPHVPGAHYRDVWNAKELEPEVRNGRAVIRIEIGPRDIGVVARTTP